MSIFKDFYRKEAPFFSGVARGVGGFAFGFISNKIKQIVTNGLFFNVDASDTKSYRSGTSENSTSWYDLIGPGASSGALPIYNTTGSGETKTGGTRTDTNAVASTEVGYQFDVTGVGNAPENLFDINVNTSTSSAINSSLTWTGNINLGSGKYYLILSAWGVFSQGPGSVTLTVGGVDYTTDWGTIRGNTDILGQTIGQGGTFPGGSPDGRRSNLTPLGSGSLTSISASAVGGGFTNIFYAVVFVPSGVSDTNFANHVVVNNIISKGLVLAIPMDGVNNGTTFTDLSANVRGSGITKAITRFGDTKTLTAVSKYYGSSGFFDGTGDYLSIPDSNDFNFSSGNFTAECWVYPTASPSQPILVGQWDGSGGGTGLSWVMLLSNDSNRYLRAAISSNGSGVDFDLISSTSLGLNQWNHCAFVRNGSTFTLYLNGVSVASTTNSNALFNATNPLTIGASSAGSQPFTGYIQDVRVYKGVSKYTSNFTLTIPKTLSLINGPTYSSIFGGSIVFDGVNDYADYTDSLNDFDLGGINATLEVWVYIPSTSGSDVILGKSGNNAGNWNLSDGFLYQFQYDNTNNRFIFAYNNGGGVSGVTVIGSGTQAINTWYQIVVVTTTANDIKFYVNTSNVASTTNAISKPSTRSLFRIGTDLSGNYTNALIPIVRFYKDKALTIGEIRQNYEAIIGRIDGSSSDRAAPSASYLVSLGITTDGVYWINLPTVGPTQIYCILNPIYDGGGWMMAMKATRGTTFSYSANYWTTTNTLNPTQNNRTDGDAKFNSMNYFQSKDMMAIFPDISNGGSIPSSTLGWTWLQNNFNDGTTITPISFFGITYPTINAGGSGKFIRDAKTFSGWASGVFSSQPDIRFYGFNYINNPTYGVNAKCRWGFGWNENGEGLYPGADVGAVKGSNDVSGGIGMDSGFGSYSAGDIIGCCADTTGINRSARVEVYIR